MRGAKNVVQNSRFHADDHDRIPNSIGEKKTGVFLYTLQKHQHIQTETESEKK